MSQRVVREAKVVSEGRPFTLTLIQNPLIDDILMYEMKLQAQTVAEGKDTSAHRVEFPIRDYLNRLGITR